MTTIPTTAKFYIEKNFYNDVNGNPRIFFEMYDSEMNYLGYCQDNYAGTNFNVGRDIRKVSSSLVRGGYRSYTASIKNDTQFENKGLK